MTTKTIAARTSNAQLSAVASEHRDPEFSTALFTVRNDWWDQAACRGPSGGLAQLFFSEELQDIAAAKRICAECPVLEPCLVGAFERREPWGVWGGQLFLNGKVLASKRRRGRPPKVARPEDQLPDIPIPEHLRGIA